MLYATDHSTLARRLHASHAAKHNITTSKTQLGGTRYKEHLIYRETANIYALLHKRFTRCLQIRQTMVAGLQFPDNAILETELQTRFDLSGRISPTFKKSVSFAPIDRL